jgi:hypothetical protein
MRVKKRPHVFGKVCAKHPELKGERYECEKCIGCLRDYQRTPEVLAKQRARQKTPESKAWRKAWGQIYRQTPTYKARLQEKRKLRLGKFFGRICPKHPELNGERYGSKHCVACHRISQKKSTQRYRQTQEYKTKRRAHRQKPEVRAREKARKQKPERRAKNLAWVMARIKTDPHFALKRRLRGLTRAIKRQGGKRAYKTIELFSCTPDYFWQHLERQFEPGMTRKNLGEWHIDHIVPCTQFDLTKPDEQRRCFHYTNLQPLWGSENMSKRDRMDWHPKQKRIARRLAKMTFDKSSKK